jgi:hypothetical protein
MSALNHCQAQNSFRLEDLYSSNSRFSINMNIVDVVTSACSIIWNKNAGGSGIFQIIFLDKIPGMFDMPAAYNHDLDMILIALRTMLEQRKLSKVNLFLVSAHEAFHKFQFFRGDNVPDSETNMNYLDCPYEKEAWVEAADALKAFYPKATGRIIINKNYSVQVPAVSSYGSLG